MRTQIVNTIFKKEIKEVLRDKRMLYLLILLPFFLYPVLFTLIGGVGASQQEKLMQQEITVLLDPAVKDSELAAVLSRQEHLKLSYGAFTAEDVKNSEHTIGLVVPANYEQSILDGQSVALDFLVDESKDVLKIRSSIIKQQIEAYNQQLLQKRLAAKELSADFVQPLLVSTTDLSPMESGNRMMTLFLPMMLLLFIFIGCIYIAIDITAGEKERRTLQTLFTTPTHTREIIAGKFLAVASIGIVSAAMNIFSLIVAMRIQSYLLGKDNGMGLTLAPDAWAWLLVLMLLSALFMAALCLAVILLANTYKEAQSYVSPLMMLVLIPAIMASMPGVELSYQTALIPVFNVALAIVALLKGSYDPAMLGVVAIVSLAFGAFALYLASLTFGNENVITGEKVGWKDLLKKG
jgi:sodium transport system permease protein